MDDDLELSKIEQLKKKLFGTQGIIAASVLFGTLFLVVVIVQSCTPRKGTILYGMCGTFLAQQMTIPETLKHTSVEQYPKAVRIYFTHIDAFGQYQFEMTECVFKQDPQKGIQVDRIFFNYIKEITKKERVPGKGRLYEVEDEYVELFNRSLSPQIVIDQDTDLTLPSRNGIRF